MEDVNSFKALIAALLAAATALWGWMGWVVLAFIICMALDYLVGTVAAGKLGEWNSAKARAGILHKLGSVAAVGAAGITDMVISQVLSNVTVNLPFKYTVALCPMVVIWYIMTEIGSILENCEKLGAPIPPFFRKMIAMCKNGVEKAGEAFTEKDSDSGSATDSNTNRP